MRRGAPWSLLALAVASTFAAPACGTARQIDPLPRVLPVDEAAQVPGFFAFRARLQRAVAEHDTAALLAAVDSAVKLSFGGAAGIDDFRREWLEGSGEDVWTELGTVLALGGRFLDDSTFYAPYTFLPYGSEEPPGYDPFEALIALGEAVPVREGPEADADTVDVLSFDVVRPEWRVSEADPPEGWTAVRLDDGSLGFVRSAAVRSPIDYRAVFSRRAGGWRMTIFIAGD